ncbi:MAG: endonuclease/exonuclease/phosphatase family protein [Bdellovibrionota bacterium]
MYLQEVCGFLQVDNGSAIKRLSVLGDKKKLRNIEMTDDPQFEFLADSIWTHHAYGKNAISSKGHHGNAVLSKTPIVSWENIDISVLGFSQRGILHGIIDMNMNAKNPKKLHVLCVHLGLLEAERKSQVKALCQRIKESVPETDAVILAGDFNDWRLTADRTLMEELDLQEGYRSIHGTLARTFPSWMPLLRLDRIYFRGLAIKQAISLTGSPWNRLSDHAPLYMEYEF